MKDKFDEIRDLIVNNPLLMITKIDLNEIRLTMEKIDKILDNLQLSNVTKKIIYHVSVELLQNTFRHGKPKIEINFCINCNSDKMYILSENLIYNDRVEQLKNQLEIVNSLNSQQELKDYYKNKLNSGVMGKGGSNIGLIDIRRKTKEKFVYNFKELDNENSLFSIIATINGITLL